MSGRHSTHDAAGDVDFEVDVRPGADAEPRRLAPGELTASALHYVRAGRVILDDAAFAVRPGESVAVTGPSGSGKSSLLALLAGLEQPDSGTVTGVNAGRQGLILQGYGLVGVLTAAENVEAALQAGALGRMRRHEIFDRSAAALAAVGLADVASHLTEELSGGQQQRVAIARALAIDPDVILADELTAELDHDSKQRVLDLVLDVARRGGIVVVATHDPDIAAACDRVLRLAGGRLVPGHTS